MPFYKLAAMAATVTMPGDSANHKLTNVEAQRIMAILTEMLSKLDLISRVPPLQLPDSDALRETLGADVLQLLEVQLLLEQQYEWVGGSQSNGEAPPAGAEMPDFETLDDELRHSTRVVCRLLKEAPGIVTQLNSVGKQVRATADPSYLLQTRPSLAQPRPPLLARLSRDFEFSHSDATPSP